MTHTFSLISHFSQKHLELSGSTSLISLITGGMLASISMIAGLVFGSIGAIVGIITIYSFLERKGLLPSKMIIKDKHERNKDKGNQTSKD